jgi:hypothetical protein
MRCKHCNEEPNTPRKPAYCPDCGEKFEKKSVKDVEFPIEIQVADRINLNRLVSKETGIDQEDLVGFHDDCEMLYDIRVGEDGSVEMIR